jgi:hypothetical protein
VRVVRTPAGDVQVDPTGRLPGRGAYLCATGSCAAAAVRHHALERALSTTIPDTLRDRLTAGSLDDQGGTRGT